MSDKPLKLHDPLTLSPCSVSYNFYDGFFLKRGISPSHWILVRFGKILKDPCGVLRGCISGDLPPELTSSMALVVPEGSEGTLSHQPVSY